MEKLPKGDIYTKGKSTIIASEGQVIPEGFEKVDRKSYEKEIEDREAGVQSSKDEAASRKIKLAKSFLDGMRATAMSKAQVEDYKEYFGIKEEE